MILSGPDNSVLLCDREWLAEAIDNIVKNAMDHTKQGDTIKIEWRTLHHIFKRFYRSRFSKDTQGIGLGLPLAKSIIEAHDGTIEVDSELGMGTKFTMNFLVSAKL